MNKEDVKVSYEQIESANNTIKTMKIGTKDYAPVNEKVKAFRKVYPTGTIETKIDDLQDEYVRVSVVVKDENGNVISTGVASETKKGMVNSTSMLENCETSAVGRALGFAGFGIDGAIASGEDINKIQDYKKFTLATGIEISESESREIVKLTVIELMRKNGMIKEELKDYLEENMWLILEDMDTNQLLKLENKLKTVNMDNSDWHMFYGNNTKIKKENMIPKNQEITYENSWYKFGKLALEKAGTDAIKRSEIIDEYINMGINLEV